MVPDFDTLDPMPAYQEDDKIDAYDNTPFSFNGSFDTDSRVCLKATGPCSIMALVYDVQN